MSSYSRGRRRPPTPSSGQQVRIDETEEGAAKLAGHPGRPRAGSPAADSGGDPWAQRAHRLQVGGRRIRRHDEHGAQAQGRPGRGRAPGPGRATSHSARRSHASFLRARRGRPRRRLPGDGHRRGRQGDSASSSRSCTARAASQLALPLPDGTCARSRRRSPARGPRRGRRERAFALFSPLTQRSEFADEGAIAELLGERDGGDRELFYCDPGRASRRACEKNHVEIRKLLPKGAGVRFDRLTAADCALLMSQVNSEPRGRSGS